jgi:TusA-related sulfurtransferase
VTRDPRPGTLRRVHTPPVPRPAAPSPATPSAASASTSSASTPSASTPSAGTPVLEVDARGRACPLPVIDLAKAVAGVPVGARVALLADDPAAGADIPAWCRMRAQVLESVEAAGDHTRYTVQRVS